MSEGLFLSSVGEKAEVTDAHEAIGEDVKQEATDKFLGIQEEGLFLIPIFSISVAQGDLSVLDLENTIVGERHAVGVAAEVIENGLRRTERRFRIDDPILLARGFHFVIG